MRVNNVGKRLPCFHKWQIDFRDKPKKSWKFCLILHKQHWFVVKLELVSLVFIFDIKILLLDKTFFCWNAHFFSKLTPEIARLEAINTAFLAERGNSADTGGTCTKWDFFFIFAHYLFKFSILILHYFLPQFSFWWSQFYSCRNWNSFRTSWTYHKPFCNYRKSKLSKELCNCNVASSNQFYWHIWNRITISSYHSAKRFTQIIIYLML